MEITIYAKKRTSGEGKTFYGYLATLTKTDGTEQMVSVKFREDCGNPDPKKCPMNIRFDKSCANLTHKTFVREDTGEAGVSYTLWVSRWEDGEPFVDHSLDEF